MIDQADIFAGDAAQHNGDDAVLAQAVGDRVGMAVPAECVPGVAANVRLLNHHIATMRQPAQAGR